MRWTRSKDGKYRVTVRVEHRLDLEALSGQLIAGFGATAFVYGRDGKVAVRLDGEGRQRRTLSQALCWMIIKDQLRYNAEKGDYWQDEFRDLESDEGIPSADEVEKWAAEQVSRL